MRVQSLPQVVPPLVQVACLAACGGDPKNPAETTAINHAPEVRSVEVQPPVVELGGKAMVLTMVADADGGPLACIYEAAHGTLTVAEPSTSCGGATYRNDGQPATSDLIRVTVTDQNNASASATVGVSILRPSPTPHPSPAPVPPPTAEPTPVPTEPPPAATPTLTPTPCVNDVPGCSGVNPTPTPVATATPCPSGVPGCSGAASFGPTGRW
jgi:hypothetical protein